MEQQPKRQFFRTLLRQGKLFCVIVGTATVVVLIGFAPTAPLTPFAIFINLLSITANLISYLTTRSRHHR